jgi:hypothetical protein
VKEARTRRERNARLSGTRSSLLCILRRPALFGKAAIDKDRLTVHFYWKIRKQSKLIQLYGTYQSSKTDGQGRARSEERTRSMSITCSGRYTVYALPMYAVITVFNILAYMRDSFHTPAPTAPRSTSSCAPTRPSARPPPSRGDSRPTGSRRTRALPQC